MKKIMLSVLIMLMLAGATFAAIPKTINFQGRLIKSDGTPITGVQPITVGLYKSPTGQSDNVWIDTFNTTVCDSQGVFNILLGSGLPLDVDFNQTLWVQITYIGETFSPRQPLCASPFAFMSITAETVVNGGSGSVPAGTIFPYVGSTAPSGYLMCDGSSQPRATYPVLSAIIVSKYGGDTNNFNVPDMRGRVPVGITTESWGNTLGKITGEVVHKLATSEMPSHSHSIRDGSMNDAGTILGLIRATNWGGESWIPEPSGGSLAHNNMQPSIIVNYIIRAY